MSEGSEIPLSDQLSEQPGVKEDSRSLLPTIPEDPTSEWLEDALKAGEVEYKGKEFFFRRYPQTSEERNWLTDNFGLPTPGPSGEGYVYHGTNIEAIRGLIERGVFGLPEHPTVSTMATEQVKNAARNRHSKIKKGIVAIWRVPWNSVDIPAGSWPEPMGWPAEKYEGERNNLDLPDHLKSSPNLRQLRPDGIVGFYILNQETSSE